LEPKKWGGGLEPSSRIEVYAYGNYDICDLLRVTAAAGTGSQ